MKIRQDISYHYMTSIPAYLNICESPSRRSVGDLSIMLLASTRTNLSATFKIKSGLVAFSCGSSYPRDPIAHRTSEDDDWGVESPPQHSN